MVPKILIVDDAAFVREILRTVLEKAGYQVVAEASNGNEALALSKSAKPNLIFMDLVMPKKSGIQATKEILAAMPDIKIIACTTLDQELLLTRALEAGCAEFVTKPFQREDIVRVVEKYSQPPEAGGVST